MTVARDRSLRKTKNEVRPAAGGQPAGRWRYPARGVGAPRSQSPNINPKKLIGPYCCNVSILRRKKEGTGNAVRSSIGADYRWRICGMRLRRERLCKKFHCAGQRVLTSRLVALQWERFGAVGTVGTVLYALSHYLPSLGTFENIVWSAIAGVIVGLLICTFREAMTWLR